jgi:uncharacterized membrane protein YccF (DUF307 family)
VGAYAAAVPRAEVDMRTLGNILWFLLAGLWLSIAYVIAGVVMCVLIVTIPFGIQAFKLASFTVWPFGRTVVPNPDASPVLGCLGNIVWIVLVGWELALLHVTAGVLLCLTIIGIPLGIACFKLVPLALLPFGQEIVPIEEVPPGTPVAYSAPPSLGDPRVT